MGGRSKKQTVGYRYHLGLHMVLCQGPVDAVQELRVGERTAWGDTSRSPLPSGHGLGALSVNAPNLFGGEKREGGVVGQVDILSGAAGQAKNDYLMAQLGAAIPAFRGVLSAVARRVYYAVANPYVKPWAFRVRRFAAGWHGGNAWNGWNAEVSAWDDVAQTNISVGMNPAHILAQCLTDPEWGMGYTDSHLGSGFWNAASVLSSEGFGLNLLWTRQEPIERFIGHVLDHIGGMLYLHPRSGQFELKLLRDDYNISNLPLLGPDEIIDMEQFERAQWGELPNEISVVYTDWETGKEAAVTVENLAAIQLQGGVINQRRDYPGVNHAPLAARLALRDLRALGSPLARVRCTVARAALAADPLPGDVVALHWPRLGIDRMVLRVVGIDTGGTDASVWRIEAVEDAFGLGQAVLAGDAPRQPPPASGALAPSLVLAAETPYWELARRLSRADLATLVDTDAHVGALAVAGGAGQLNWTLATGPNAVDLVEGAQEDYAPLLVLANALPGTEADALLLPIASMRDADRLAVGDYAYLIDVAGQIVEAVEILAIDTLNATVSLARGMLDTTPRAHPAGTRLVGVGDWFASEDIERAPGEHVHVAAVPYTATDGGAATLAGNGQPLTLVGRQARPYPPGRVRLNAQADPAVVAGDLAIAWAHRDRIQQTAYLVHQDEGDIGPEAGTTYTVRIRDRNGALVRTYTGLAGTAQTWDVATAAADAGTNGDTVTIEIDSERAGWSSWTQQSRTVERAGWGLRYGQYWGGV